MTLLNTSLKFQQVWWIVFMQLVFKIFANLKFWKESVKYNRKIIFKVEIFENEQTHALKIEFHHKVEIRIHTWCGFPQWWK